MPNAGSYALSVRFANGSGTTASHSIVVNGSASSTLSCPSTGWDKWTTVTKQVALNAGNNMIRSTRGTNYAERDYIELPRYEAEQATLNRAAVVSEPRASNGLKAGNIDYADSSVTFSVNVPSAGADTMRVLYSTGAGASTHRVSVNGGTSKAADLSSHCHPHLLC